MSVEVRAAIGEAEPVGAVNGARDAVGAVGGAGPARRAPRAAPGEIQPGRLLQHTRTHALNTQQSYHGTTRLDSAR